MVGPKNRNHNRNYSFRVVEINVWATRLVNSAYAVLAKALLDDLAA